MRQIKNKNLAELLMQLRFTPLKKRRKQLDAAEKLCEIIAKDKEYPFEFVCFRITGFHPKKTDPSELIRGDQLLEDLQFFIAKLSSRVPAPAAQQAEEVHSIEQLAASLGVSTKTINRWRKKGLIARKFIFEDGTKRLGFLQSTIDRFFEANPGLVTRPKKLVRLTTREKKQIIKETARLAATVNLSRHQIINRVAAKFGRVHETIRYTILNYEKANPDKPVSRPPKKSWRTGVIDPSQAAEIHKLFRQGCDIKDLMEKFSRSKSSIYRLINQRRAKELLTKKIEFVPSDEFQQEGAGQKILEPPIAKPPLSVFDRRQGGKAAEATEPFELAGVSLLPEYLRTLKDTPVLSRDREAELFRRYNYVKYLAAGARAGIKPNHISGVLLEQIEDYLAEAEAIRKMIINANLRLVVSIAMKHTATGANLMDLISRGNLCLVEEVDKFDYTRGYRFGVRIAWAITKEYARKVSAAPFSVFDRRQGGRPDKVVRMDQAEHQLQAAADIAAIEKARQNLAQVIANNLDEREQYIILNHFGLLGSPIKKKIKTLKQIGEDLGISKERVRQIELFALQKLRQSISPKEFDLLTG